MIAHIQHVNADAGHIYSTYDMPNRVEGESRGDLYRRLMRLFGRCKGYIFVGDDSPRRVGWHFVKREGYEDSPGTFLMETWVTLVERVEFYAEV